MTKIDIISGFLGAGKTTLIKKLIKEAYQGEKIVLIENEFGEIGIDGGFMQDSGIQINELNSGCICCSLVGDFGKALTKVLNELAPDRIIIEPSGVGKLSDVIRAVQGAGTEGAELNAFTTVADVNKVNLYMKNFGEFYNDQVSNAGCIVLSHTGTASDDKINKAVALLREKNEKAVIVTTNWDDLYGLDILTAMEQKDTLQAELEKLLEEQDEEEHEHHHHHHHDDDDEEECCCGHHHHDEDDDDDEECCCGHHHHHDDDDDDDECCCGHHHHDEDDDDECECGHHHHEHHHHEYDENGVCSCGHHHHHHADEVFTSWGKETTKKFTFEEIQAICDEFDNNASEYGLILRSKGIVEGIDGSWIHFDYVPCECNVRIGSAGIIGRLCVIGSKMNEENIAKLFKL